MAPRMKVETSADQATPKKAVPRKAAPKATPAQKKAPDPAPAPSPDVAASPAPAPDQTSVPAQDPTPASIANPAPAPSQTPGQNPTSDSDQGPAPDQDQRQDGPRPHDDTADQRPKRDFADMRRSFFGWVHRTFPGHEHAFWGGAIALLVALLVFVIGLPRVLLMCVLVVVGVAIGQVADGDPKIIRAITRLFNSERDQS